MPHNVRGKVHIYHPLSSRTRYCILYKCHQHRIHSNKDRSQFPGSASRPPAMPDHSPRRRSARPRAQGAYRPPSRSCPHAPPSPVRAPRRGRPAMRFACASRVAVSEMCAAKGEEACVVGEWALDKHLCVSSCIRGLRERSVGAANFMKRSLEIICTKQDKKGGKSARVA